MVDDEVELLPDFRKIVIAWMMFLVSLIARENDIMPTNPAQLKANAIFLEWQEADWWKAVGERPRINHTHAHPSPYRSET